MDTLKELLAIHEAKCKTKKVKKIAEGSEMDLGDMIDKWLQANRMYHFEGSRGVSNFDKLIRVIGYRSMDEFLSDNSGCIESIIEWIKDQNVSDWAANLNNNMGPGENEKESNDVSELVDEYLEGNKFYHFEGSRGVSNLDTLIDVLGYRDMDEFLSDNSGCLEAMIEWIKDARVPEWNEKFAGILSSTSDSE